NPPSPNPPSNDSSPTPPRSWRCSEFYFRKASTASMTFSIGMSCMQRKSIGHSRRKHGVHYAF
ncbi:MAG: hypothetical protein ACK53Y_25410, partial [bacterium]